MNSTDGMQPQDASSVSATPTAGQMLRAAREARGLHLAVLSVNLKVSVRQLEALEADRHDALKGAAFVRALALSVCRQLKLDPSAVMAALPKGDAPKVLDPVAKAAAHSPARSSSRQRSHKGLSRQVLLLAVLMLAGVAALVWWPDIQWPETSRNDPAASNQPAPEVMGQAQNPEQTPAEAAPAALVPAASPASAPAPALAAASASLTRPASEPVSPSALPSASKPALAPVVTASAAPAAPSPSVAPVRSSVSAPLVLRLKADAWVEIRDKFRGVALKRQVKAGEVLELDLQAPVFVYTSRADHTELQWQGKAVDVSGNTQNNELRIQIKP
jgi:cytoskeleton protein RodZ